MHTSRWIVTVAAVMMGAGGAVFGLADNEANRSVPATTNAVKHQMTCPVMGGAVNKSIFVDHQGKRVYLCCGACVKAVEADPEKYIKKLEAEGITLDMTPRVATTNAPAATPRQGQDERKTEEHSGHHH